MKNLRVLILSCLATVLAPALCPAQLQFHVDPDNKMLWFSGSTTGSSRVTFDDLLGFYEVSMQFSNGGSLTGASESMNLTNLGLLTS